MTIDVIRIYSFKKPGEALTPPGDHPLLLLKTTHFLFKEPLHHSFTAQGRIIHRIYSWAGLSYFTAAKPLSTEKLLYLLKVRATLQPPGPLLTILVKTKSSYKISSFEKPAGHSANQPGPP